MKTIKTFILLLSVSLIFGCSSDDGPKASNPGNPGTAETCDKTNTCTVTIRTTKNFVFKSTFFVDDVVAYRLGARQTNRCDHRDIPQYYQALISGGLLQLAQVIETQKCKNLSSEMTAYLKTSPSGRTQLQLIGNRDLNELFQLISILSLPTQDRLTVTSDDLVPQFNFAIMQNAKVKKLNSETSNHTYELTDSSFNARGFRFYLDGKLTNNTHSLLLTMEFDGVEVFQQEVVR